MENTTNDPEEHFSGVCQWCCNSTMGKFQKHNLSDDEAWTDAQIRNEMLLKILVANENMFGMWSRTSLKVEGKVDPSFWLKI